MRRIAVGVVSSLALMTACLTVEGQDPKAKAPAKTVQPAPKGPTLATTVPAKDPAADQTAAPGQQSPAEVAIRLTGETYVKAFNQANSKAVAEHYTPDAEFIDDRGAALQGRTAIEESLKAFFAENPEPKLELKIDSIRFVGPGVAIEDGLTLVSSKKTPEPISTRYTAVHMKLAGKWQVASVRDTAIKSPRQHRAQLRQLDWMLGEWVHEGSDAVVVFNCEPVDNGNFLLRTFTVQIAGQQTMSGSQRIGWDAQVGKFKAWIFDSDGGHSDGYWHRDGDSWVLKSSGVTADGQTASNTSIYQTVNPHTMTFQSVDHEVAGVELPDSVPVKIVRHPPKPE